MRRPIALATLAALAALAVTATPSTALQLPTQPAAGSSALVRVADLYPQRTVTYKHRYKSHARHRGEAYWHARATRSRTLHYLYVNAGWPVRHAYDDEVIYTYLPGDYRWRPYPDWHRYWAPHRHWHQHHWHHYHGHHHHWR